MRHVKHELKQVAGLPTPEPDESVDAYCFRAFGDEPRACLRCRRAKVFHPGVCDACDKELQRETESLIKVVPKTEDEKLDRAGIPAAYRDWRWAGLPTPSDFNLASIRAWAGDPPLLAIVGPTGTGKTGAAVCIARDWMLNGRQVQWHYLPDLLDDLRWMEGEGDPRGAVNDLIRFDGLVVLDEMATRRVTEYGTERVLQLIDGRVRGGRPLLVTSNLPPTGAGPSLADYDQRIASRVAGGYVVRWTGPDQRIRRSA